MVGKCYSSRGSRKLSIRKNCVVDDRFNNADILADCEKKNLHRNIPQTKASDIGAGVGKKMKQGKVQKSANPDRKLDHAITFSFADIIAAKEVSKSLTTGFTI